MSSSCIHTTVYHAPCGDLMLGSYGGKLCLCDWLTERHREFIGRRLTRELQADICEQEDAVISEARSRLDGYFRRECREFDLPLLLVGTDFQKRVWQALQQIPYGTVISYKQLAERVGMPSATHAVANANNRNAISIIIPCHRVIGADGSLTGYGGGLDTKRYLLDLEQNNQVLDI